MSKDGPFNKKRPIDSRFVKIKNALICLAMSKIVMIYAASIP